MCAKQSHNQPMRNLPTMEDESHQSNPLEEFPRVRKSALYQILRVKGDRSVKRRKGVGEPVGKLSPLKRSSSDRLLRLVRVQPVCFGEDNSDVTIALPGVQESGASTRLVMELGRSVTGRFQRKSQKKSQGNVRNGTRSKSQGVPMPVTEVRSLHSIEEVG